MGSWVNGTAGSMGSWVYRTTGSIWAGGQDTLWAASTFCSGAFYAVGSKMGWVSPTVLPPLDDGQCAGAAPIRSEPFLHVNGMVMAHRQAEPHTHELQLFRAGSDSNSRPGSGGGGSTSQDQQDQPIRLLGGLAVKPPPEMFNATTGPQLNAIAADNGDTADGTVVDLEAWFFKPTRLNKSAGDGLRLGAVARSGGGLDTESEKHKGRRAKEKKGKDKKPAASSSLSSHIRNSTVSTFPSGSSSSRFGISSRFVLALLAPPSPSPDVAFAHLFQRQALVPLAIVASGATNWHSSAISSATGWAWTYSRDALERVLEALIRPLHSEVVVPLDTDMVYLRDPEAVNRLLDAAKGLAALFAMADEDEMQQQQQQSPRPPAAAVAVASSPGKGGRAETLPNDHDDGLALARNASLAIPVLHVLSTWLELSQERLRKSGAAAGHVEALHKGLGLIATLAGELLRPGWEQWRTLNRPAGGDDDDDDGDDDDDDDDDND
ncbi:hypothetical protein B0T26DRAFT_755012 [Lasiosphaeria miniovina]|uniref:Uncharacterized protein n=1 Tax=Lasiosphaeria miniovina TaxID=1954250 RepID=A0AA40A614_9PEZI|nr:uncharacterized protein B0T26DRAFT_755012 [Lasiosphaeria miniovina]KAK0709870.1 hypothetical protein B0T26DRAFT_755012 [Lasiosphaeria miniovina]